LDCGDPVDLRSAGDQPLQEGLGPLRRLKVWAFAKLARPHFLLGGFLMFALGASFAPTIFRTSYFLGQTAVTFTQLTAHFLNEYGDWESDRGTQHRTFFSGGSGVLSLGTVRPEVALKSTLVTSLLAGIATAALATSDLRLGLIGITALAIAWSYSLPPPRLVGRGYGEVLTSAVVTALVPLMGLLSQRGSPSLRFWECVAVLFLIHLAMMLCFELPDLETDAAAAKRVIAVRLGEVNTQRLIGALLVVAFALGGVTNWRPALAGIPAGLLTVLAMRRRNWQVLTASAVATFALPALVTVIENVARR
jgi:1,4-dihydroxy-2-naphthoate octaprenyltransferase